MPLKNNYWLEEGERPLSKRAFLKRMTLLDIVCRKRQFEFWFDDGDMFWGHAIYVTGSVGRGPMHANLFG